MGSLIRTLLIWLLVLAVPAQGAVASTMALCDASHRDEGTAVHAQHGSAAAHAHEGGDDRSAHAHHAMTPQADGDAGVSATAAAPAKGVDGDAHKRSHCASCCTAGVILDTVLAVPAPELAAVVYCTAVTTVDAFAADGPDRPPRVVRA